MEWQGRRESGNVVDQRSFGKGSIGIGTLVLGAIAYYFMGGNPIDYLAQNAPSAIQGTQSSSTHSASELDQQRKSFVSVVLADTEDVWSEQFRAISRTYTAPKLVLFTGRIQSGCGNASSSTGPFYCPSDRQVYLDTSFFDELSNSLGAKGASANAYVIAHEIGHHVQNLLGLTDVAERQGLSHNQSSVVIELQADCFAGVWAAHETKYFERGDVDNILNAASAIGDDRLQKRSGHDVMPDSFTHGSSAQRTAAFRRGLDGGNLQACLNR
jgi:predicted metalloprotease